MLYILIIITLILDFLLNYLFSFNFNNLNLFYPMLTLTLIVYLYSKLDKNYFKITFIIGFLYDLLFSYIFLFNSLIFLLFAKIIKKIDKYIRCNSLVLLVLLIFLIFIYDLILFILVNITKYNIVTFKDLLYKFKNSLLLNILYFLLLTIIFNKKKLKFK